MSTYKFKIRPLSKFDNRENVANEQFYIQLNSKGEAKQALLDEFSRLMLEVIGEDQKSRHIKRWQCPNYGNDCWSHEEFWKSSQVIYCSNDGRKMILVEFDEPDGSDWDKNELKAQQRLALSEYIERLRGS